MGTLYIVATPIGNLGDITLRAIEILGEVDFIACEDTRKTGFLLKFLAEVQPPMRLDLKRERPNLLSYYEENELRRIPQIISLLKAGKNVALVSNAGTPTISDPGFKLVREAIHQGIPVVSIPGPSAVLTALTSSGLPTDKFLFLGYPPKKGGKRRKLFENLRALKAIEPFNNLTIILFESPHRLLKTLENIQEVLGDIDIVICRELTKMHEEVRREKISQSIAHFGKTPPRGEFTLLFNLIFLQS